MGTYQLIYENDEQLNQFISELPQSSEPLNFKVLTSVSPETYYSIYASIRLIMPQAQIMGIYSKNLISNNNMTTPKTLVIPLISDTASIRIHYQSYDKSKSNAIPKDIMPNKQENKHIELFTHLTISENQLLLQSISAKLNTLNISGGILSKDSLLFFNDTSIRKGYIGIITYCHDLHNTFSYIDSLKAVGPTHPITGILKNTITHINHRPIKDYYKFYTGKDIAKNQMIIKSFPLVKVVNKVMYPAIIGDMHMDGSFDTSSPLKLGDMVRIGYRDDRTQANDILTTIQTLCQATYDRGCFYFAPNFYQLLEDVNDTKIIEKLPSHLIGLELDYQFVPDVDSLRIHNYAFTIDLLSSSLVANPVTPVYNPFDENDKLIDLDVLLNIMDKVSTNSGIFNPELQASLFEKNSSLLSNYYKNQLTHLPNLNKLNEDIEYNNVHALCLIDIQRFVHIINFYGSSIGNTILREFSAFIEKYNTSHRLKTYHIHSDVFAIAPIHDSYRLFNNQMRILQNFIHDYIYLKESHSIYLTTTFALSDYCQSIFDTTNITLQYAKEKSIDFLTYSQTLNIEETINNNLVWVSRIRKAIKDKRIVIYFQPIYNNTTDQVDQFEVLMRLIDEEGNSVGPENFLSIARKAGLYNQLTRIIVQKAFAYFKSSAMKFSINISANDIMNSHTCAFIYNQLASFPNPQNVIFEIVESEYIEHEEAIVRFIKEVKKKGAKIAIDDFGTGFSNFNYLYRLNIDCIKIDGSIIQQMITDQSAAVVAESIVDFANRLGIYTVAEYVSDVDLFERMKNIGVHFSQGYFIAKPSAEISL